MLFRELASYTVQRTMALCYVFSCFVEHNDCSMDILTVKWLSLSTIFNYQTCTHITGNGFPELCPKHQLPWLSPILLSFEVPSYSDWDDEETRHPAHLG